MSKFKRVLSDDQAILDMASDCELFFPDEDIESDLVLFARRIEQAVLAKLAEQEPVMYARTYYGEIDWGETCVTEENDGMLMHATDMRKEDFIRHGYEIIPLYTHPMPCVSPTSDKTACVSENAESDIQRHLEYIKRYQKWRRGEDKTMSEAGLEPKQIGESLDWLVCFVENHIADASKMVPEGFQLAPVEPTEEMHLAARDWSVKKYGKAIGSEASHGCYQAMLAAAPKYTGEK